MPTSLAGLHAMRAERVNGRRANEGQEPHVPPGNEPRRVLMQRSGEPTMSLKNAVAAATVALTVVALAPSAGAADTTFGGTRVSVASGKSFEQVVDGLKSLVAKNGMMVMAEVDQGKMLSMTGLSLKATLFLVGNPTVGKQVFEQEHAAGLYIPLRVFVYVDANGKTFIEYDKPSSLLGQFKNDKVAMVADMLDKKLEGLANMAAQ
jgi:uncharacterized protein (DUF302 family)